MENLKLRLYHFKDISALELYKILQLRTRVFIMEQECLYADIDGRDVDSYHLWMADDNDDIKGYLRILPAGVSGEYASIGRVVVDKDFRGNGHGIEMMEKAIDFLNRDLGYDTIRISAQQYLHGFYEDLGFERKGEVYMEDNIPHVEMFWGKKVKAERLKRENLKG